MTAPSSVAAHCHACGESASIVRGEDGVLRCAYCNVPYGDADFSVIEEGHYRLAYDHLGIAFDLDRVRLERNQRCWWLAMSSAPREETELRGLLASDRR